MNSKNRRPSSVSALNTQFLLFRVRCFKDEAAFAEIYSRHKDVTYRLLRSKLPTSEDAEDALSATFIRLWNYLTATSRVEHLGGLIHTIAKAVIHEHYRRRPPPTTSIVSSDGQTMDLEDRKAHGSIAAGADLALALEAMEKLKEEHRELLIMRFVAGLTISEMAERIGRQENATRVYLHRALKELRGVLEHEHEK